MDEKNLFIMIFFIIMIYLKCMWYCCYGKPKKKDGVGIGKMLDIILIKRWLA